MAQRSYNHKNPGLLEDPIGCPVEGCSMQKTRYRSSLVRHFRKYHPELDVKLALPEVINEEAKDCYESKRVCPEYACCATFTLVASFRTHLVEIHGKNKEEASELANVRAVRVAPERLSVQAQCPLCTNKYWKRSTLAVHLMAMHDLKVLYII